jgi:hypothetical protein
MQIRRSDESEMISAKCVCVHKVFNLQKVFKPLSFSKNQC